MKTKSFVPFFTLPVDADVKSRKIYEKTDTVQDYFLKAQTYYHKIFHYKFLLTSLDNVCVSQLLSPCVPLPKEQVGIVYKQNSHHSWWISTENTIEYTRME
jgi:hypothetical protein